jgi:hypothetical protein
MKTITTLSSLFAIGMVYFLFTKWLHAGKVTLDFSSEDPIIYL